MDFQPNEEQRMFAESARKFLSREFPLQRVRDIESQGLSAFLPCYREMAKLGYLALGIPEQAGGSGTWLDLELFAEEAGRALVPPLQIASIAIGAQALAAFGRADTVAALLAGESVLAPAWLEQDEASREPPRSTQCGRRGDAFVIEGEKRHVLGFEVAGELLVAARGDDGPCFALVPADAPGISSRRAVLTSGDTVSDLRFGSVKVERERLLRGSWSDWLRIMDGAKIIAAAWAVGAARAAIDMALGYAKDRKQFGVPIGKFQAVQHRLAEAAITLEQACAMVRYAAWLHATRTDCAREAAMAKIVAGKAVRQVTHAATLTHGGYGFMEEFDIQLYFRRATLFEHLVEGPATQREILAADAGEDLLRVF